VDSTEWRSEVTGTQELSSDGALVGVTDNRNSPVDPAGHSECEERPLTASYHVRTEDAYTVYQRTWEPVAFNLRDERLACDSVDFKYVSRNRTAFTGDGVDQDGKDISCDR